MKTRRRFVIATLILALQLGLGLAVRAAESLPAQLTDEEFWKLSSESSEPDGTFRSDNLLSNESYFQYVIPRLNEMTKPGRVYMGVGPEQNFTYIAALKPKIVTASMRSPPRKISSPPWKRSCRANCFTRKI